MSLYTLYSTMTAPISIFCPYTQDPFHLFEEGVAAEVRQVGKCRLLYNTPCTCASTTEWAWDICCDVWGLSQWPFRTYAKLWCGILCLRRVCCI